MPCLSQIRVVELGDLPAASYCARLLADLGAEVIRRVDPAIAVDPSSPAGAWSAFLHFGKRATTEALDGLLAEADVCIDSRPEPSPLPHAASDLVHVDVSWFGRSGPYAGYAGSDAMCRALAGLVQLVGPAAGPPLVAPDGQAAVIGGLGACIGVLAALLGRERGLGGRHLEASVLEACVALSEYQASEGVINGWIDRRFGSNRFQPTFPLGVYPAADGWVGITLITPAQWRDFCRLAGLDALADAPDLVLGTDRLPRAAELEAAFMPKLRERSVAEWCRLGLAHRLPIVAVPTTADVLADAPFRDRGAVVPIEAGGRTAWGPGAPFGLSRTPAARGGRVDAAPTLPAAFRSLRRLSSPKRDNGPPLRGLRVVDLTMGWAGPLATRMLADLGADVVKVEACRYPDWWRGFDRRPAALAEVRHERTGRFIVMNRNKRGITLDLTTPAGTDLLRQLVRTADAVVENYSPGVLPKLGLAYEDLRKINPNVVMASMSAFGSKGERRECRAYGSTLEHGSGLPHLVGEPDGPPTMGHLAFGDAIGGLNAGCALLAALLHRARTGEGQHIDIAQVECMLPFTAVPLMLHSLTGTVPPRTGSRRDDRVPHGVFPCRGDDRWVLVAAETEDQWQPLCQVIGRPDLAADPVLGSVEGRRSHQERIEAAVAAWTAEHDPAEAMATLQAAGVTAGTVTSPGRLHEDAHLRARGFWQWQDRAFVGNHPEASLPFREGAGPFAARMPAPTLGQHNTEVLAALGLSAAEIAALEAAGVIGTAPAWDVDERQRSHAA